jgi:hypothetical protein
MREGLRLVGRSAGTLLGLGLPSQPGTSEVSGRARVIPFRGPRRFKAATQVEDDCD